MSVRTPWPTRLDTQADLDAALLKIAARDKPFGKALALIGPPALRRSPPGFGAIVGSILGQQVSAQAARAIQAKLLARTGPLTPDAIRALSDEELRGCGLSGAKTRYVRALADACHGGLDIDGLHRHDDETIITQLTALPGIGRWTAEVYLLFALGRIDVWPADDLALQVGAGRLRRLKERLRGKAAREIADRWAPAKGAAALFMWHYYHHLTARDAVLADPTKAASPEKEPA
ncbi:DNA-3-methyladenine glycosylase family protein [Lacibacterium aquatile]|uniref:DNA-3-methyladenine glycosylase II n=1 Tax=Lacibacterium aquatile TaxID=1168082 RepID=A0ABW5DQ92_9PROT